MWIKSAIASIVAMPSVAVQAHPVECRMENPSGGVTTTEVDMSPSHRTLWATAGSTRLPFTVMYDQGDTLIARNETPNLSIELRFRYSTGAMMQTIHMGAGNIVMHGQCPV